MQGQMEETVRFWLIEPTLFLAILCAVLASWLGTTRRLNTRMAVSLGVLIGFGAVFNFSPWSWRSGIVNTALGSLGYLASIALTYLLIALVGMHWLRWLLRAVAAIPILVGTVLGTVGILGLIFVIGDCTPRHIEQLTPRYAYVVRLAGGAYTREDFADVSIVRYYQFIPLQHTIWSKSFSDHQYDWESDGLPVRLSSDKRHATVTANKVGGGIETDIINLP